MKKIFIVFVCVALVAAFVVLFMQDLPRIDDKMYRIGVPKPLPSLQPAFEGFKLGMEKIGYEEGRNISYTVIEEGGNSAETKENLAAFIRTKPDLIYALGVSAARDAKEITAKENPSLPVVFGVVSDPVGNGLIADFVSSKNNLTGIAGGNEIIAAKRVELFLEMVPETKRIIFIWNNALTTGVKHVREAVQARPGIVLLEHQVQNEADIDVYLATLSIQPGDALFRAPDSVVARRVKVLSAWSLEHGVPLVGTNREDTSLGALMSYGPNFVEIGVQAAELANRVLSGVRPIDIPVAYPTRYELVLNTDTMEKLDLTFSRDALVNVDAYVP